MAKRRKGRERTKARKPAVSPPATESARAGDPTGTDVDIPKWLPAVVFLAITAFLFRSFIFSNEMLFGGDTLGLGYVARSLYADALSTFGTIPAWAPNILGGTPFIEALSAGDSLYPPSALLLMMMETHRALGWKLVVHVAAAGFFMFGWVRVIGGSRAAALVAGTAYLAAPYLVTLVRPGHDGKMFVTALAPLLFWMVERHFQRASLSGMAGIALVVGAVMLTTHFQHAYFLFGAVGFYAMFRTWEQWSEGRGSTEPSGEVNDDDRSNGDDAASAPSGPSPSSPLRLPAIRFSTFLFASLLGAGVAAVQLLPAVDYVREDSRRIQTTREAAGEAGVAWASSYSMHPEEVVSLVLPEFVGNNSGGADWSQRSYWGRNLGRDNVPSAGLVILLLAALSFAGGSRRGLRYFFTGLGTVAVLFALGTNTPVWGIFYAVVPGIPQFRAPDQMMFVFVFSVVTLGAIGVDRLLRALAEDDDESWKPVVRVALGSGAAVLFLAMLAGSGILSSLWTSVFWSEIPEGNLARMQAHQTHIASGAALMTFLALLVVGVVLAAQRSWLAPAGLVASLTLLVAVDEVRIGHSFISTFDPAPVYAADPFTQLLLDREGPDGEPYRYLTLAGGQPGQDVFPALHGIELAAGHHPNDLARYRDLIGMVGSNPPWNLINHPQIRRLLNVRYVRWPEAGAGSPLPGGTTIIAQSPLPDGSIAEAMYLEPDLPRARLVGGAVVLSDEEAVPYMQDPGFDPEAEAVLSEASPITLDGGAPEGSVTWTERSHDHLAWTVTTDRPALLVVADNYFPAWQATVDGAEAPVLRAYHTLRAVPVPAGEHTVEMTYHNPVLQGSLWLSLLLSLALLGILVADVVGQRKTEAQAA